MLRARAARRGGGGERSVGGGRAGRDSGDRGRAAVAEIGDLLRDRLRECEQVLDAPTILELLHCGVG